MTSDKLTFDGIPQFLAVAEYRSFSRAAEMLGVTPTAVSKSVRQLESRHGTVLFQRTTRSVVLTEAGAALFRELRPAVDQLSSALSVLDAYRDRPMGTLRLTMSRLSMRLLVEPIIAEYSALYPDVTLDISVDDGTVDLASGGFDAGIRHGDAVEKDMIAIKLTSQTHWVVVGSPAYFVRAGEPSAPADLVDHHGILYRFVTSGQIYRWEFSRGRRDYVIDMKGQLVVNDRAALTSLAKRGLGLAYVASSEVSAELASGELKAVLASHIRPSAGAFLYFPSGAQKQLKLRAFIDIAKRVARETTDKPA